MSSSLQCRSDGTLEVRLVNHEWDLAFLMIIANDPEKKSNPEDPLLNEFLEATTDKNGKSILTVIVACCAGHFAVVNFSFVVETESKCNRCSSLQHQDLENFCSTTDE